MVLAKIMTFLHPFILGKIGQEKSVWYRSR